MPNRTRIAPRVRQDDRWLVPLPHPSWSGETLAANPAPPLLAAEFWHRLGL